MSKDKRALLRQQKLQRRSKENQKHADRKEVMKMLGDVGIGLREKFIELIILAAIEHLIVASEDSSDEYFDDGIRFLRHHLEINFNGSVLKDTEGLQVIREHVKNPARRSLVDNLLAIKC